MILKHKQLYYVHQYVVPVGENREEVTENFLEFRQDMSIHIQKKKKSKDTKQDDILKASSYIYI